MLRKIARDVDDEDTNPKAIDVEFSRRLLSFVDMFKGDNDFIGGRTHCLRTLLYYALQCGDLYILDMSSYRVIKEKVRKFVGIDMSIMGDFCFEFGGSFKENVSFEIGEDLYGKIDSMVDDFYFSSIDDFLRFLVVFSLDKLFDDKRLDVEVSYQYERSEVLENFIDKFLEGRIFDFMDSDVDYLE